MDIIKPQLGQQPEWENNSAGIPTPTLAWPLVERGGDKVVDQSPNDNSGTLVNTPLWATRGLNFIAASAQKVDTNKNFPISGAGLWTVSCWVNTTTTSSLAIWGWGDNSGSGTEAFCRTENGSVALRVNNGNRIWTSTGLNDGNWHHLVVSDPVGNTSGMRAWMDGVELSVSGTSARAMAIVATSFSIGGHNRGVFYYDGLIDNVCVYSTGLSHSHVDFLYRHPYYAWEYAPVWCWPNPVAAGGGQSYQAAVSDGVNVSEILASKGSFNSSVSDGLVSSDSSGALKRIVESLFDGIDVGGASGSKASFSSNIQDSVDLSSFATSVLSALSQVSDGVTVSDLTSIAGTVFSAIIADGVIISEVVTTVSSLSISDSVLLSDASTSTANFIVSVPDSVTISDVVSTIGSFFAAISELVNVSDGAVVSAELAAGMVKISFSLKKSKISFSLKKPEVKFTLH